MRSNFLIALIGLFFYITINSCKKDDLGSKQNPLTIENPSEILKNIPIRNDSVLFYSNYQIDFRIEIENHTILKVKITCNGYTSEFVDNNIISTELLSLYEKDQKVTFLITTTENKTNETVMFSLETVFKQDDSLADDFITFSKENGKLKLNWNELDKDNTIGYSIERVVGNNQFTQNLEVSDSVLIDDYFVGEEVTYHISVINKEGEIQRIWHIIREKENRKLLISQVGNNYTVNIEKCPYYNNFGSFLLYRTINYENVLISSTENINDTAFTILNVNFADEASFYYEYYPKEFPNGANEYTSEKYNIYNYWYHGEFGNESFIYDGIAILDNENIAYTRNGRIYKYNVISNQKTDSIVKDDAYYGLLSATPSGSYIYAVDENIYESSVYIWSTNTFTTGPDYTFQIDYIVPPISDNLIAFMSVPSGTTASKLALYNVTNGNTIYTTDYDSYSGRRRVSSNGEYFLTDGEELKLFSYINNTFESIYIENDWTKTYSFFDFDPMNKEVCYVWDYDKNFSIRTTSAFSEIKSFPLELEQIINIDYYSKKILGYTADKILIYNLEDGTLEKEIPANIWALVGWSSKTIMLNNTIFNNQGVKYTISGSHNL